MINVTIKNKVASLSDPNIAAVCDNDYTVVFDFDEEWDSYANKTARFTFNDSYRDVVFSGDSVEMAYISNAPHVDIGVYAGDLCTTTPARLYLRRSIRSGTGAQAEPTEEVYDKIMDEIDTLIEHGGLSENSIGRGLKFDDNKIVVDTVDEARDGEMRPITSSAVSREIGNINILLNNI